MVGAEKQYDVAFSFAGEDRAYVEKVAHALREQGITVFYDKYEEVELWGKDLYAHLQGIYRDKARYTVVYVSSHYATKNWCNHELRSASARAFEENAEYILPARFDNTDIKGILPTIGFIDLRQKTPKEFAFLIFQKIYKSKASVFEDIESGMSGRVIDSYRIGKFIGAGGFGCVYRCEHETLNQIAAIKLSHSVNDVEQNKVDNLLLRLSILRTFTHKNAAKLYRFGTVEIGGNRHIYLIMDFVEGKPLRMFLGPCTSLQSQKALEAVFVKVCETIRAAHCHIWKPSTWSAELGIVHGDIKPGNVIVDSDNNAIVVDFDQLNFAQISESWEKRARYTQQDGYTWNETGVVDGDIYGTPGYIAPEMLWGKIKAPDPLTDIFALGITLFELFTGVKPPVYHRHNLSDHLDFLAEMAGSFKPSWFKAALAGTLCNREERFSSIGNLLELANGDKNG